MLLSDVNNYINTYNHYQSTIVTILQLSLVFLAALLHASWNIASKYGAHAGYNFAFAYKTFSFLFYLPWIIYLLLIDNIQFRFEIAFVLFLTAALHLLYSLSLLKGYQRSSLSIVYPVSRGSGPLITSFVAIIFLGEQLGLFELFGILSICIGVLFLATKSSLKDLISSGSHWVGVRWGLFIGTIIASYSIVDAYAVKTLLIAPVLVNWVSSFGGMLMLTPKVLSSKILFKEQMRGIWPFAIFVGLVSPMAYILILFVLRSGAQISIVAPLRESSMVFGALAGVFLFKEKVSVTAWFGCLLILSGVFLIAY